MTRRALAIAMLVALGVLVHASEGSAANARSSAADAAISPPPPPIVFVSRQPPPANMRGEVPGLGPRGRALAVGGRLMVRESDGRVHELIAAGRLFDVSRPAVSWDARLIAFAALEKPDSPWRLWCVSVDGTGLVPLTFDPPSRDLSWAGAAASRLSRAEDFDPCWVAPRRLVFASTRWPLLAEYGGVATTNLYALDLEREDNLPRRLTTERNGVAAPAYDPQTGRIVFSRWWHNRFHASDLDASGITSDAALALPADSANLWQLVSFDPAKHETNLAAGDARSRVTCMATQPAVLANGSIVAVFARHLGMIPTAGGVGIARFGPAARSPADTTGTNATSRASPTSLPAALAAPVRLAGPPLPAGPIDPYRDAAGLASPQASCPAVLPDGRIVFAADPGARGDWELEVMDADGTHRRALADLAGTLELDPAPIVRRSWREHAWSLEASALDAASPPREVPSTPGAGEPSFTFHCLNLFSNAPPGAPITSAPPVTPNLRLRFFAVLARADTAFGDTAVLVREVPVSARGEVLARGLPVDVPMFEQVVDERSHVLMSAHGPAHVAGMNASAPGERRCVGCHTGHSAMPVPASLDDARWFNAAPGARASASQGGLRGAFAAIDRRLEGPNAEWITLVTDSAAWSQAHTAPARADSIAWLRLEWPVALEMREVVLHTLREAAGSSAAELRFERSGRVIETRRVSVAAGVAPTRIALGVIRVDALEIRMASEVRARRGLAEVEVIARLP